MTSGGLLSVFGVKTHNCPKQLYMAFIIHSAFIDIVWGGGDIAVHESVDCNFMCSSVTASMCTMDRM